MYDKPLTITPNRPTAMNILDFPLEILRQILYKALMCEIEERQPYPFGRRSLPYDRPLNPFFVLEELAILEQHVWLQPSFWGREPMTRLMRVNKLFSEEVYKILWSDFALFTGGVKPNHGWNTVYWLVNNNPRALDTVRHLHISYEVMVDLREFSACQKDENAGLVLYVGSFSRLLSVRLQIRVSSPYEPVWYLPDEDQLPGPGTEETEEAKKNAVDKILHVVALCGKVNVKICWEPNYLWPGAKTIVDRCIEILGQNSELPELYQKHAISWPTRYAYVRPEYEDTINGMAHYECPPPRYGDLQCYQSPSWPLKTWPVIKRPDS
jgi:hypothetical protein